MVKPGELSDLVRPDRVRRVLGSPGNLTPEDVYLGRGEFRTARERVKEHTLRRRRADASR